MTDRTYDLVIFGATGFTGGLVARYLAGRLEPGVRWAIAGRSTEKLAKLRRELEREDARMAEVGLVEADSGDPASLHAMARSARAIITTVGPFARYGEPLVAACVDERCDYFDITGEPTWWRSIVERYDERARTDDVIVVPCCGYDSMPFDLGALFTASLLPRDQPITIDAFARMHGRFSGGTWATVLNELSGGGAQAGKQARSESGNQPRARIHYSDEVDGWALPAPTVDPLVVRRSAELTGELGSELRYREYMVFRSLGQLAQFGASVGVAALLAKLPPTRKLLQRLQPQGTGPAPEVRAKSHFRVDFIGRGGGREVRTHVSGGDPGYTETAKMISEAAITCLELRDQLPRRGVLTPASAFGHALIERLRAAGIEFAVD